MRGGRQKEEKDGKSVEEVRGREGLSQRVDDVEIAVFYVIAAVVFFCLFLVLYGKRLLKWLTM